MLIKTISSFEGHFKQGNSLPASVINCIILADVSPSKFSNPIPPLKFTGHPERHIHDPMKSNVYKNRKENKQEIICGFKPILAAIRCVMLTDSWDWVSDWRRHDSFSAHNSFKDNLAEVACCFADYLGILAFFSRF